MLSVGGWMGMETSGSRQLVAPEHYAVPTLLPTGSTTVEDGGYTGAASTTSFTSPDSSSSG